MLLYIRCLISPLFTALSLPTASLRCWRPVSQAARQHSLPPVLPRRTSSGCVRFIGTWVVGRGWTVVSTAGGGGGRLATQANIDPSQPRTSSRNPCGSLNDASASIASEAEQISQGRTMLLRPSRPPRWGLSPPRCRHRCAAPPAAPACPAELPWQLCVNSVRHSRRPGDSIAARRDVTPPPSPALHSYSACKPTEWANTSAA